jgi:uncharacterized protein (TIGR01777 family)
MKILVSGASGLLGSDLVAVLRAMGHEVSRLVRDEARAEVGDAFWNPMAGEIDSTALQGCDAVVNLAGESIAAGRWTTAKKARIRESRVVGTRTIARALAQATRRPKTLINASAVGFYGNRGDELLDESSPPGRDDFLSEVCQAWEAATEPAAQAGVRVVTQRFGVILSGQGGALKKMLLPFRLGLGGKIGSGRQWMSWVSLDDALAATLHCLRTESLHGPVNVVAPQAVTNLEYTKTLGRVLSRPTIFPMPALAARAAFGQMADALLLAGQRVQPARLSGSGFAFRYPNLEQALRHVLERP